MKAFFVVIVTVTITSMLWAAFRNALDPNLTSEDVPTRVRRTEGEWPRLDGGPDNIFWMVQVRSLHGGKKKPHKKTDEEKEKKKERKKGVGGGDLERVNLSATETEVNRSQAFPPVLNLATKREIIDGTVR